VEPLDNPVWHSLRGPHAGLADTHGKAARYPAEVAAFSAVVDEQGDEAWADLATLHGPRPHPVLFRDVIAPPPTWEVLMRFPTLQLVAPDSIDSEPCAITELSIDDVDDMLALVELTEPGPFFRRTIELGTYLGVRQEGRLVALAGERMRIDGATELSAVCTHPDVRGSGLARALIAELVTRIRARGDLAFLHVLEENTTAIAAYGRLGFEVRRPMDVGVAGMRRPAS
jgi:predicted GNAT family acetyltransferase